MTWLDLSAVVTLYILGSCAAVIFGFNVAVKRIPWILARMTPEQLRDLAAATDERRPKT